MIREILLMLRYTKRSLRSWTSSRRRNVPIGDHNIVAFNAGRVFSLEYFMELVKPLVVVEQRFIVGKSFQDTYEYSPIFSTTGLFELTKPKASGRND